MAKVMIMYIPNDAASELLGCRPTTLKKSRHTGTLFGADSPEYIKRGRRIFYDQDVITTWLGQFDKFQNTSQYKPVGAAGSSEESAVGT